MCKQAQECGIPTSGSYLQRHGLIDIKLMVYIYISEWEGVSHSIVVFPSFIHHDTGAGTNLDSSNCATNVTGAYDPCYAAFLSIHLTPYSTAYFEVGSDVGLV